MISTIRKTISKLASSYYTIGFIDGGIDAVMERKKQTAHFIKWSLIDNDGSWFADPFILDVDERQIIVLVEEMPTSIHKGVITKLTIDRQTYEVLDKRVIMNLPNHLSFPDIVRKDGKIYIAPENGKTGPLQLYEYDPVTDSVQHCSTICDDIIWDAAVAEIYNGNYLFGATVSDKILDIYKWDDDLKRYIRYQQIESKEDDSRLAGEPFEYKSQFYYPAQLCDKYYGRGVRIKQITYKDGVFGVENHKTIFSPHKTLKLGMHTLNSYKGYTVIDVRGFKHTKIGPIIHFSERMILKLLGKKM